MDVESGWAGQSELAAAQAHPLGLPYFFLGRISSLQSRVNCCRGGRKHPILSPTCLFSYLPPPVPGTKPPFPSIVMKSYSPCMSVKKLSPDVLCVMPGRWGLFSEVRPGTTRFHVNLHLSCLFVANHFCYDQHLCNPTSAEKLPSLILWVTQHSSYWRSLHHHHTPLRCCLPFHNFHIPS